MLHTGLIIKQLVEKNFSSTAEFARKMGKTPQTINNLYKTKHPGSEMLTKVSEVLGIPVQQILNYEDHLFTQSQVQEMEPSYDSKKLYPDNNEDNDLEKSILRLSAYEKLFELKEKGVLTDEEFSIEKAKLLKL
jgi:transcriptional regulator with XRE-family HTH domain